MEYSRKRGCIMQVFVDSKNGPQVINLNRRRAIRQRCLDCSGWSPKEVAECQHTDCPLHPFRTGQGKQDAKKRAASIRDFCRWCMNGQLHEVTLCPSRTCSLFPYRQSRVDRSVEIGHQDDRKAIYDNK